jgi:signal peptidase I
VKASLVLGPLLDVLAPADAAAAGRRVRNAAVVLALAAWLLPSYGGLGTDTTAHRAAICVPFAAAAVAAQFRHAHRWARVALPILACAAAAVVAWCGGGALWGLGFVVYAVLVLAATDLRLRRFPLEPSPDDPDPLPPRPRLATRVMTGYAWFCISAALVTHWGMQIMFVPTGSMQPTIMGARLTDGGHMGDVLLVDRSRYLVRDPRRWEIVVFEYPLFPSIYFVKRLVGLPGEHVEIKDGDIWIDGKIAKKPPLVQETLWREVAPRQVTPDSFGSAKRLQQCWAQVETSRGGDWKPLGPDEIRGKSAKDDSTYLGCSQRIEGRDARLSFDVSVEFPSYVVARIHSRGTPVELVLPTGDSTMSEFSAGEAKAAGVMDTLGYRTPAPRRVELTVLDGETWWALDGEERQRLPLPAGGRGDTRVEIGVRGEATFRDLRVESDVVYKPGAAAAWDLPADGFFFLGDNVAGSDDSRKWTALRFQPSGGAPPVFAEAEPPNETGKRSNQIRIDGRLQRFVDVDLVPRALPRDTPYESVPYPFARREHIVGRAVMIVFPWNVADKGFRPRFLP